MSGGVCDTDETLKTGFLNYFGMKKNIPKCLCDEKKLNT